MPPPSRRQSTLALAFLLLEAGRPVAADQLADAVWPQGPPSSWPSGLRRIVSDVRTWLRSGEVDAEVRSAHGSYELVLPPGVATDVDIGRTALSVARWADDDADPRANVDQARQAVELLQAPLLPGYDILWLQLHRQDLERDLVEAFDLLADAERRAGNPDAAVASAERAIAMDPLRESSYRQVMAAHRQAGRIGAALRTYEQCRRYLAEEVGTSPSPVTTTLYHRLLDLQVDRVSVPAAMGPVDEAKDAVAAAAAAMGRLESRQTIAALEARLATIDAAPSPDPVRRVETLIELGQAHWLVEGGTEALRRISLAAGEAALSLRLAGPFCDALALASTTTGVGQADPDAEDLCRRGPGVFPGNASVRVRASGLQAELVFGWESIDLAQRAVDGARAVDDERLLLDMLLVLDQSLAWTPDIDRRLAVARECSELLVRVQQGFRRRPTFEVMTRLQAADVEGLRRMGEKYVGRRPPRSWELRVYESALRGVEANLAGDLERAQQVGTELLQESAGELNSVHAAGGLLLAVARDSGGIGDLLPAIDGMVASNPRIAAFRAALATAHVVAGDEATGRDLVARQAKDGWDDVPHEHTYLLYLGLMAEAVALIEAAEHVEPLLEMLAPYEGQLCVGAHGIVVLNAMDSYRGMLATVTGDPRGRGWLDAGMAVEERIGALLLWARSAAWKVAWLRRHGGPGDEPEADRLLERAREVADAAPDRIGLRQMVDHLSAGR